MKPFYFLFIVSVCLLEISCNSYSPIFNKIYKANKLIDEGDIEGASDENDDFKKSRGSTRIKETHKVAYSFNLARLYFHEGKVVKARDQSIGLLSQFENLKPEVREKLEAQNITRENILKLLNDIELSLPQNLPLPFNNIAEEQKDEIKRRIDSLDRIKDFVGVQERLEEKMRLQGKPMPTISDLNIERNGKDVIITYSYGDRDNVKINIAAFPLGAYITETSINGLYLFKGLLEEFVVSETGINYDSVTISIWGMADGTPFENRKYYKNEFKTIENETYTYINKNKNELHRKSIYGNDEILNEELALLRAYHPKFVVKNIPKFRNSIFNIYAEEREREGAEYRKVTIKIFMKNAFKLVEQWDALTQYYVKNSTSEKGVEFNDEEKPLQFYKNKIAIIIGVSNYEKLNAGPKGENKSTSSSMLFDLKYAHEDANDFEAFLEKENISSGGWQIEKLINEEANFAKMSRILESKLSNATSDDLIYIFFSGHGVSDPDNPNDVYLLPYNFDPEYLPASAYSYQKLLEQVSKSKCQHIILFIDACRSGAVPILASGAKGNLAPAHLDIPDLGSKALSMGETKVILCSSIGSTMSYEGNEAMQNGYFTYFLMEALYGACDDKLINPFVDLIEVTDYVILKVREATSTKEFTRGPQIPQQIGFTGNQSQAYPLAVRQKK